MNLSFFDWDFAVSENDVVMAVKFKLSDPQKYIICKTSDEDFIFLAEIAAMLSKTFKINA